ncbi:MAG: biopolymer transporter ExbD [Planctomycetota bacterium]
MKRRARDSDRVEFAMTSFVDVVFSLLIFFVVTARFVPPEMRVPVFLSASGRTTAESVPTRPFLMNVYAEGEDGAIVYYANKDYNVRDKNKMEALEKELEEYRERNTDKDGNLLADARAIVAPGNSVIWEHVITVIDLAKTLKIPVGMRTGG